MRLRVHDSILPSSRFDLLKNYALAHSSAIYHGLIIYSVHVITMILRENLNRRKLGGQIRSFLGNLFNVRTHHDARKN